MSNNLINKKQSFLPLKQGVKVKYLYKRGNIIKKERIYYQITTRKDKKLYEEYKNILSEQYEKYIENKNISDNITAYRENAKKNNIDYAYEVFKCIKNLKDTYIYVLDFKDFFSNLDHKILKKQMCKINNDINLKDGIYSLYRNVTKYRYYQENTETKMKKIRVNHKEYGIPQGLCVSGVLSNIYMMDFDIALNEYIENLHGIYRRYSDDIIILLPVEDGNIKDIIDKIKEMVREKAKINISEDKEKLFYYNKDNIINRGELIGKENAKKVLEYLGFEFNGKQIKIKSATIGRFYKRMYSKINTIIKNPITKKGHRVSKKNLYKLYSSRTIKGGNFAGYEKEAEDKIKDIEFVSYRRRFNRKIVKKLKNI